MSAYVKQDELLTSEEAAEYLKVPVQTIWRWCRQGTLPAVKLGKYWRIPAARLAAFLEAEVGKAHTGEEIHE